MSDLGTSQYTSFSSILCYVGGAAAIIALVTGSIIPLALAGIALFVTLSYTNALGTSTPPPKKGKRSA
jgi:hypothetical protein